MKELRMMTTLKRIQEFKQTVNESGWYYSLIQRMIVENIHEKPLAMFMSGKNLHCLCCLD